MAARRGDAIVALVAICLIDVVVIHGGNRLERTPWLLWPVLAVGQGFQMLVGQSGQAFLYFQF